MSAAAKKRVQVQQRDMPGLFLRAEVVANSYNEAERTIDVVWSTGAKGLRRNYWDGDYYEELSLDPAHVRMGRMNAGAPVLDTHNQYQLSGVIGVVERAAVDGKEGTAKVRFSKREDIAPMVEDIKDGIIRNISVGYRVYTYEKTEKVDEKIPTYRAIDWEPAEISFVPVNFDSGAQTRDNDAGRLHSVQIITRGAAATAEETDMTPEEIAAAEAKRKAELEAEQVRVATAAKAEGAREERVRIDQIRKAARAVGLDDAFAEDLVTRGVPVEQARAAIIDKKAEQQAASQPNTVAASEPKIENGEQRRDKWLAQAEAWMFQRAGLKDLAKHAGVTADPGECRGFTMMDLARAALESHGEKTGGMDRMKLVERALTLRTGYNGTNDFTVLFENVMHKVLQAAYATQADTWSLFCKRGSVSDFRAHNRYRQGSFGVLDDLLENGEYKQKQIPDGAKESIRAATKGNIIGLTRESIINDDMSAFNDLAVRFGRAARLTIEVKVYATLAENSGLGPLLADGLPIFDAAHGNITTSSALSAAAIDIDRVAMGSQFDLSGNELLDLSPELLLIPKSKGSVARQINNDTYDPDTLANRAQMKTNPVQGLFSTIVDTARLTGNRRYLFANKEIAPVIEVVFLDGNDTPFLDTKEGWRSDGIEWKVRLDFGVGGVGYVGALTNAGG
jgi:hypothetical protein